MEQFLNQGDLWVLTLLGGKSCIVLIVNRHKSQYLKNNCNQKNIKLTNCVNFQNAIMLHVILMAVITLGGDYADTLQLRY